MICVPVLLLLSILLVSASAAPGRSKNVSAAPLSVAELNVLNGIGFLTEYWLLLFLLMLSIAIPFIVVYYHYRKSKVNINTLNNVSSSTSASSSFLLSLFRFWYETARCDRVLFILLWSVVFASSVLLLSSGILALDDYQSTPSDGNDSALRAMRNTSRAFCTLALLMAVLVGWRAHRQCLDSASTATEGIELRPLGVQVYH